MLNVSYDRFGVHVSIAPTPRYQNLPSAPGHLQTVQRIDDAKITQSEIINAVLEAARLDGDAFGYTAYEYAEQMLNDLAAQADDMIDLLMCVLKPESERGVEFRKQVEQLVVRIAKARGAQ